MVAEGVPAAMPSPWKKAKVVEIPARLVSSLRSKAKRGDGGPPLDLRAGFPTFVAGVVVKHQFRLMKQPGRPRGGAGDGDARCSTMAGLTCKIVAASTAHNRLLTPPASPLLEMDEQRPRLPFAKEYNELESFDGEEGFHGSKRTINGVVGSKAEKPEFFWPSAQPKPPKTEQTEISPIAEARKGGAPSAPEKAERKDLGGGGGGSWGFMLVAKVALPMFILVVLSKEVAIAISALAFAFMFAESMGGLLIPGPCKEANKRLCAIVGGVVPVSDLNKAPGESSSRGLGGIPFLLRSLAELDLGSFRSGRNPDGFCGDQEASSTSNRKKTTKKKKLFRKFVPIKFRGRRRVKEGDLEGKVDAALISTGEEEEDDDRVVDYAKNDGEEVTEEESSSSEEEEESEEEEGSRLQIPAMEDADLDGAKEGDSLKGISEHLFFFAVVLCGLIGGRVVALVLTVLWYSVLSGAQSLWRRWCSSRRRLGTASDASTPEGLSNGGEA